MSPIPSPFIIRRESLLTGVVTPIIPLMSASRVQVMNKTGMALRVYTTVDDDTTYLEIADDFYQEFDLPAPRFRHDEIAFYLKAAANGTAILIWK